MKKYLKSAAAALREDEVLASLGVNVFTADSENRQKVAAKVKGGISAELRSLGFSQARASGPLAIFYYFGVVLKLNNTLLNENLNRETDIEEAAERIVTVLHHRRLETIMAIFSKCIRLYETHSVALNSRIIKIDVKDGEKVSLVLFYSSRLPLSDIENLVSGSGGGSSGSEGSSGTFIPGMGLQGGVWD